MPNKKAPGPDGFPAEFYKEFWAILAPTFYRMLQETQRNGRLPPNMNYANISLLLNQAKTLYCLLAIVQYPLLMWTLNNLQSYLKRIEKITPLIIHYDQTGFIKGRHSFTNTRRLLNLIDYSCNRNLNYNIVSRCRKSF